MQNDLMPLPKHVHLNGFNILGLRQKTTDHMSPGNLRFLDSLDRTKRWGMWEGAASFPPVTLGNSA